MPEIPFTRSEEILTQLVTGPSIREVASAALRAALTIAFPSLNIDPAQAMVVTPVWNITQGQVIPGDSQFESLTDALVRSVLSAQTVTYLDGEHFLTLQPDAHPAVQLPVKIDAIGRLINQQIPLLFVAFQEQQLDYWNQQVENATPRWYQLSDSLRNLWQPPHPENWDADQKAMALALFTYPEQAIRRRRDTYNTKACLVDVDESNEHMRTLDIAVLVGTRGARTWVITHSITEGFKHYDSLDSFGESIPRRASRTATVHGLKWRLYEPTGNFFDHQACALIALELEAIGQLNDSISARALMPKTSASTDNPEGVYAGRFKQVQRSLPDWLLNAQPADLTRYSRHLMDLALLREQHAGKSFLDDIAPLRAFTLQTLEDRVRTDHPEATDLKLENVEITITSLVVYGTFIVPGRTDSVTMSLTDLALQNLIAVPLGDKTVRRTDGSAVESWMTPQYLEQLVTDVDIGKIYPDLIKRTLLGETKETQRRQDLFASHLRIQLPLQTLQFKIRGEAGVDDLGYQYTVAVMQKNAADRYVDGLEIVIRPLAFIPGGRADGKADEVTNMFVIGPRLTDKGPCLLFRPLLAPTLLQYPCEANLLYAIKHDQTLRQSILAWLPDDVRFNYSQYVFPGQLPSAWTLTQWLVDPTSALGMMGALTLAVTPLAEPSLNTLFTANANAMITLADRQTVSNAQSRWATLKQGAWMLFNVALPFLGRTVSIAAWIWQIMDDLHEANEALEQGDSEHSWAALTDVFLSVAMVLAHHAATRNKPVSRAVEMTATRLGEKPLEAPPPEITVTQLPDMAGQTLPVSHQTTLYSHGATSRTGLGVLLNELAITRPDGLTSPSSQAGPHQHLYPLNQKWYAQVGPRWFEVALQDNEDVQIIDTRQSPPRDGPLLSHLTTGWVIDTRLRLRGGGRSRNELVRENARRKAELQQQLTTFDAQKLALQTALETAESAAGARSPEGNTPQGQQLIQTLNSQLVIYGGYIEQLKAFNALESISNYRAVLVSCLDYQLLLAQKWFNRQNPVMGNCLHRSLALFDKEPIEHTQPPRQTHQQTSDQTQGFIEKIEFAHARIEELKKLGKEAAEVAAHYTTTLPKFDLQDLKLFQISLAQELCLNDTGTVATDSARKSLATLVENANLTIQSSLDLVQDEQALVLSERIDGLNDLVDQFATIDQRILDLPGEYPGELLQPSMDLMRQRIEAFNQNAVRHLASLLNERRTLEPAPGSSRSATAPKRLIKTRFKGAVVGKSRARANTSDTDLVDVTSPLTGKVIATFHEKTPGVWVEHVSPKTPAPTAMRLTLNISVQDGQTLLEQLPAFTRRTEGHSKGAQRMPWEIEEMFHQQAGRLEEAANSIDQALTDNNATDGGSGSVANVIKKRLTDGATELYKKGRDIRIQMTKRQPPTAGRVEWLHNNRLVKITGPANRQRLKGKRKDYLDEYKILDHETGNVLWYAHFHYPAQDASRSAFTAAHLKTIEQRGLGGAYEIHGALGDLQSIAIYRAEINQRLARSLFFSRHP